MSLTVTMSMKQTYICEKVRIEGFYVLNYPKAPELCSIINVRTVGNQKRFLHRGISICNIQGKGKVHPITGHEGEMEANDSLASTSHTGSYKDHTILLLRTTYECFSVCLNILMLILHGFYLSFGSSSQLFTIFTYN